MLHFTLPRIWVLNIVMVHWQWTINCQMTWHHHFHFAYSHFKLISLALATPFPVCLCLFPHLVLTFVMNLLFWTMGYFISIAFKSAKFTFLIPTYLTIFSQSCLSQQDHQSVVIYYLYYFVILTSIIIFNFRFALVNQK